MSAKTCFVVGGVGLCLALTVSGEALADSGAQAPVNAATGTPASAAASPVASFPVAPSPAPAPAVSASPTASPEAVKEAGERYSRGLSLYGDGEFLLALVEFERAYELSQNYRVLYNVGQVRIQLGRYAKGREALEQYLKLGGDGINAERVQAVNKDLAMLVERTASLTIASNQAGADISIDGKMVGSSPLAAPLVVDAGEHSLVVHKAGFYDQTRSVTLAGRDQIDVRVDLLPVPEAAGQRVVVERTVERVDKPARTGMWVAWATTGVFAATAGVSGYFGISKANELQSMRTTYGVTVGQLDNLKSSANTLLIISDVTTGLAAVAGGVALYLTLANPNEHAPTTRAASTAPSFSLGLSPGGVRVRAAF